MELVYLLIHFALFPIRVSTNQLLPDTLFLSESLSHFGKCTFTLLRSQLYTGTGSSNAITDTSYEIEPLKVSKKKIQEHIPNKRALIS